MCHLMDVPGVLQRTLLTILLSLLPALAFSVETSYSPPASYESTRGIARVTDPHGLLRHEERSALEDHLASFWNRTGLKVSILIDSPVNSWESLESYTVRTAKKWELAGTAEQPGGLLMVIDPQTHRAALSISSELIKDFPSGSIEQIINGTINPILASGALAYGITEGFDRTAAYLEKPDRMNRSLFARGYGTAAAFGLFLIGIMLRRVWGTFKSAVATSLAFGAVICFDGFSLGFSWFEVLSCAILAAPFLGMFVWVGMGNDIPMDEPKESI